MFEIPQELLIHTAKLYNFLGQSDDWQNPNEYSEPIELICRIETSSKQFKTINDELVQANLLLMVNHFEGLKFDVVDKVEFNNIEYKVIQADAPLGYEINHWEVYLEKA